MVIITPPPSPDVCRYTLDFIVSDEDGRILWICYNPSTGSFINPDKTMKKMMERSKRAGYGYMKILNLHCGVCKDPKKSNKSFSKESDEENRSIVSNVINLEHWDKIVYAWGHGKQEPKWLRNAMKNRTPYCIDKNKDGSPMHPGERSKGYSTGVKLDTLYR